MRAGMTRRARRQPPDGGRSAAVASFAGPGGWRDLAAPLGKETEAPPMTEPRDLTATEARRLIARPRAVVLPMSRDEIKSGSHSSVLIYF